MRLIDADALIADLEYDVELDERALDDMHIVGVERTHLQYDKDCKQSAIELLRQTPTIDAEKHGRWLASGVITIDGLEKLKMCIGKCSVCNEYTYEVKAEELSNDVLYEYCPHCGARMEQKE